MKRFFALSSSAALVFGALAFAAPAIASASVVYDNTSTVPIPGNVPSQAFEATQTVEFGGQIQLAGTDRANPTVTVLMSSWGCESGSWNLGNCSTTPGSTFSEPVTLNIYNVNGDNTPGSLITTVTQTFNIPFRPSADAACGDGRWSPNGGVNCYNGFATPIVFNTSGVLLPDKVIVSVAYNTSHYGNPAIGENTACYTSSGGCGYDSLNVALTAPPSVGSDPVADSAYVNSGWAGEYCDTNTTILNTFRLDPGCWIGYQPAIKIEAVNPVPSVPTITLPTNNSCVTSANQQLIDWTDSTGGVGPIVYQYQAYTDAAYTNQIYDSLMSLSSSQIATPGTPPGTYYIRVRSQGSVGAASDWSNGPTNPYKVVVASDNLTFSNFLSPISGKSFNTGSTIPVKIQVLNGCGVPVNAGSPKVSITGPSSFSLLNQVFKYDTTLKQFIYNWNTKGDKVGQYTLTVSGTGVTGSPTPDKVNLTK